MFSRFYKPLRYKEFNGLGESGTDSYLAESTIQGLRIKGQTKVTTDKNGQSVTCSIVYRVERYVPPNSLIEGREVMECVPINSLSLNTGYLCYMR